MNVGENHETVKTFIIIGLVFLGLLGCASEPEPTISYDPAALQFNGEQAFATETEFVTQFPNRDSGQPNNRLAAEWLQAQFTELGLTCTMQEIETHPNPEQIIATFSLDNLGKEFYDGVRMSVTGQLGGVGLLWL
jgi:hypothetical protein